MKISELRIGNYINFNNRIGGKVNGTDINGNFKITLSFFKSLAFNIDNDEDVELSNYYSPIPLTEEILLKCGFKKDKISDYYQLFFGDYTICGRLGEEFVLFSNGDETETEIEYLHELQNLYFALTGTELKK